MVASLAGYYAFQSALPDCGPPRNTTLGHIYWAVPLALLLAQSGVIARAGRIAGRSQTLTIVIVVLAGTVSVVGGAGIFLHFFAAGNCGE